MCCVVVLLLSYITYLGSQIFAAASAGVVIGDLRWNWKGWRRGAGKDRRRSGVVRTLKPLTPPSSGPRPGLRTGVNVKVFIPVETEMRKKNSPFE